MPEGDVISLFHLGISNLCNRDFGTISRFETEFVYLNQNGEDGQSIRMFRGFCKVVVLLAVMNDVKFGRISFKKIKK
jgi:hypothetical protein